MGKTFKDLKKHGKEVLNVSKKKERKPFAPATKKEKPKKGKGSYERENAAEEDEEKKACWNGYKKKGMKKKGDKMVNNCIEESITKFIEAIMTENHADAHKYLVATVNQKLRDKIAEEIKKPLF